MALTLAAMATFGIYLYLQDVKQEATSGPTMTNVIVAKEDIPAGSDLQDLVAEGAFTTIRVPSDLVVPGAITDLSQLASKEATDALVAQEQIPLARLDGTLPGGTLGIARGFEAISIPIPAARTVGGEIQRGNMVALYGTFDGIPVEMGGPSVTVVLVPKAEVLKVTAPDGSALAGNSDEVVLTLELRGRDAQKVIYASEEGSIWTALLAPGSVAPAPGSIGIKGVTP
jgi:Flp pilus assembly protein CpaB